MQDIEQNMDELLRKAAEGYPLKTGDSNWDKIAPALLSITVVPAPANKKGDKKKYAGLLLLLLPLLLAGIFFIKYRNSNSEMKESHPPLENRAATYPVRATTVADEKQRAKKAPANQTNYSLYRHQQPVNDAALSFYKSKLATAVVNGSLNKSGANKKISRTPEVYQPLPELTTATNEDTRESELLLHNVILAKDNPVFQGKVIIGNDNMEQENRIFLQETTVANEKKPSPLQKHRGIYLGVAAAPVFSQVKSQGLKKPGFDIGIIAGYQFNDQVAVETGLLFARKSYFSGGKYFNMDKAGSSMPPGMEVLSLDGSSSVFEIPVKLKYNLWHKKRASLFSSAGITSYLVTNEKNNYLAILNGAQQNITNTYKNSSRYFAAAFDISLGYERRIGRSASVRIEPFLQIPLKGIGIGSLPVMSSGLRIGFSKFIH